MLYYLFNGRCSICGDAFLGLSKTCAKLGIAFWDYLGARLAVPGCPEGSGAVVRTCNTTP